MQARLLVVVLLQYTIANSFLVSAENAEREAVINLDKLLFCLSVASCFGIGYSLYKLYKIEKYLFYVKYSTIVIRNNV